MRTIKFYLSLITIVSILILGYFVSDFLSIDFLKQEKNFLLTFVQNHSILSPLIYIVFYAITIALSFPSAAILSLAGGFLFGFLPGVFYINISATSGATISFLLYSYLFKSRFAQKYQNLVHNINAELERSGNLYLITIRLIPVMPFFFANLLIGLTNVSTKTFLWTTALGIVPSTALFCFAGKELHTIQSTADVLSTRIIGILFLLATFSLLPIVIKKKQTKKMC